MPIPALPLFRHRDTVVTPADQNQFVTQFETTMDTMSNDVIPAMNTSISDMNTQYNNIYNNLPFAPDSGYSQAYIDTNIYKKTETYNKTEIDSITIINNFIDKPTPGDTDKFVLQEVGGVLKKVSFQNLTKLSPNDSRVKTALNASGTAPIYACRAWVNFNGTGTVAIRASGNISSITDNGIGNYTVNFTTAMSNTNYSIIWGNDTDVDAASNFSSPGAVSRQLGFISSLKTTSSFTIYSGFNTAVGGVPTKLDFREINISIFA